MKEIVSLTTIQDVVGQFLDFANRIIPREVVSIIIQLCATSVILIIVAKFVFKPVREILRKRAEYVENQIREAEDSKNRSLEYEREIKDSIDGAKQEALQIVSNAKVQSESMREIAMIKLDEELEIKRKNAQLEIEQEKVAAVEEIRKEIVDVALMASETVLNREVNSEDNSRLVEDFVKDVVK